MYRVVDTINHRTEWLRHHPDLPQEEGVLAVLDSAHVRAPFKGVVHVRVSRPDGSSGVLDVAEVRIGAGGVIGLFFHGISEAEIPRGSVVQPSE